MKQWLRVVGALALVVASGVEARAQIGGARGRVVDENGAAVEGATVEFVILGEVERKYDTRTNDKGEYAKMLPRGPYRVIVSKDGYQGTYLDQIVRTGDPTDIPTLKIVSLEEVNRKAMAPIREQFEKAAELSAAGKLDEAMAVYRELEAQHPDVATLHFNIGTIYARQEKWPEAEAAYQKALELDPDNVQTRVVLADVHRRMGRTEEALAEMEKVIEEQPDDPSFQYDLGVFYLNARRDKEAFACFERVRQLNPDNVDVLYLLGTLSINLGQVDQATGFLQSYLDTAPEDGRYRDTARELISKIQPPESQ